jgi:thioredoxin-related protein
MKRFSLVCFSLLVSAFQVFASEAWLTDFDQARAKAQEGNKPILALFTGSDWCPGCKRLQKEVLSTPEFSDYAAKNVVLLEVDFPMKKAQSKEQKQANEKLQDKYDVEAYPTVVVINAKGKKLGKIEFEGEDAKAFIGRIDKAVKKGAKS